MCGVKARIAFAVFHRHGPSRNARRVVTGTADPMRNTGAHVSAVAPATFRRPAARADTLRRRAKRRPGVGESMRAMPVHPLTPAIALGVRWMDGENRAKVETSTPRPHDRRGRALSTRVLTA